MSFSPHQNKSGQPEPYSSLIYHNSRSENDFDGLNKSISVDYFNKLINELEDYRNIFAYANDAILIIEPETGMIIEANVKACQIYGIDRETFIGKSIGQLGNLTEHDEIALLKLLWAKPNLSFETIHFHAGGTPIELLVNSSIVKYQDQPVILSINRDITEHNRTKQLLLHNALHDTLTNLPNRALFLEHLQRSMNLNLRRRTTFAVLFLDFDRFKIINDSLGHLEGDRLLIMIAQRLQSAVRSCDIVARMGGDEFTILLDGLENINEGLLVADRLQHELKSPFDLSGHEIFISASIGLALSSSAYTKPEDMLRDADTAMYYAKANGKACLQIFNQTMREAARVRLQLETELRRALEHRQFCVYYQPIVDLRSDRIIGFESLVRWNHPTRGIVLPGEFIPLAEENGLIIPLGEWVLLASCRQLRSWQIQNPANSGLTISVNLSYKQFLQNDLVECVAGILQTTGLAAEYLRLEVTESHLIDDSEKAIMIMNRLRALGIKLSIDDFGTGFSSLSYLHRLPINYLKIDRSFVSRIQPNTKDSGIVQTIISLAKNLGIEVIAEGIETIEQSALLKRLRCEYGQGYLYSEPVTAVQAGMLINSNYLEDNPATENQKWSVQIAVYNQDLPDKD